MLPKCRDKFSHWVEIVYDHTLLNDKKRIQLFCLYVIVCCLSSKLRDFSISDDLFA